MPVAALILYLMFEVFFMLLFDYGMVFNLLFPFIAYSLILVLSVGIDYIIESRQKEEAEKNARKKSLSCSYGLST